MSRRLLSLAIFSALALVFVGPGLSRPETTNPAATIPVKVTITERGISVRPSSAVRGVAAQFIVTNRGRKVRTIVLRDVGIGKRPGFTARLAPDEQKIFVMFLDYRGMLKCQSPGTPVLSCTFRVT